VSTEKRIFRYESLTKEIESKIARGTYHPGERLPSIRKLHHQSSLSISTVYKTFMDLEAMGLVQARPRSGYYVSSFPLKALRAPVHEKKASPPQKVRLSSMINSVVSAINDSSLLPLGLTVTDPELLPVKTFSRILNKISRSKLGSLMSYSLSEGCPELRRQLALRTLGVIDGIRPEDIIITNGCMEAVSLSLLALTQPGDTVATETPTNFTFLQLLKELGRMVVEVPTDPRLGVDVDEFEKVLRAHPVKACLFMPNFHNPVGALMPDKTKKRLVELLQEHEIPAIEDDVSSELCFGDQRPPPLKAFDRKDLVLTCSSFSKTLAPGLRIGWVIPGSRHRERIQNLKAGTTVSTSTLDQYLVSELLAMGAYERHMRSLRSSLKKQMIRTAFTIQKHFPPDTRLMVPEGGSLLWVQLPSGIDGLRVHRRALEHDIAIIPGVVCSNTGQFRNYIQISCAFPFTVATERGIATLGRIVYRLSDSGLSPRTSAPVHGKP
jgi:DNA-binding transcriptional MocR family regulator